MKVAIVGLGLLGSSLAMALRGRGDYEIYGYARRPAVVDWALANQVADFASTDPVAVIREADLTVLALPIPQIIAFMRQHCNEFKPGGIVTDIGSIKGDICRAALNINCRVRRLYPKKSNLFFFVFKYKLAGIRQHFGTFKP